MTQQLTSKEKENDGLTDKQLDERWLRRLAARKTLINEADDLFIAICELEGGPAAIEAIFTPMSPERLDVMRWVSRLPKFNKAARLRAMSVE